MQKDQDMEPNKRREPSVGKGLFTAGAVLRSVALSLMDTADRIAEWLAGKAKPTDG